MTVADPDEALIEAIRAIGREHRPASVSVLDLSVRFVSRWTEVDQ